MVKRTQLNVPPRPFLKWAGGKTQLIEQYQKYFPTDFHNYYEPFLGGGAVFFHLVRNYPEFKAFLSDINEELIKTYCCVRDRVQDLIGLLDEHQLKHNSDYYYEVRAQSEGNSLQKAARIIYLNKTCFNGLYRENSKGEFNVPLGRYKNPKISDAALLESVSVALQSATIKHQYFDKVLELAQNSEDFVYFDPPYYPLSSTSRFTSYTRYSFSEEEQIKLQKVFSELANKDVKVMLSNSDCDFIRGLYQDFKIHEISASRAINSKGNKRGKISELLITSY